MRVGRPRSLSVCSEPGCPELAEGWCSKHRRTTVDNRPSAARRGYDKRWAAESKAYLLAHPWCSQPGCPEPATHTDHVDGEGPLGPRGYDWANFQGLCHSHHSSKTATYDGGFGNQPKTGWG